MRPREASGGRGRRDDASAGAEVAEEVAEHSGSGVRFQLLLDHARSTRERAVYRGVVSTVGEELAIEVVVAAAATEAELLVHSESPTSGALLAKAAALVRAAARGPLLEGLPPPRRIHRWRARD